MIIKPILKLASAMVLMGALGTANAASISLTPSSVDAAAGDIISMDVIMDFSDVVTIGGGFDISFDTSVLSFVSWDANPVGDPGFARLPDVLDGLLSGIAVGDFNAGITGIQNLGTVTFEVVAGATRGINTVMPGDTSSVAGPFVDFNTFQVVPVTYNGAQVNVGAVPVPAAVWLMFGGLGALFGFGRKRA